MRVFLFVAVRWLLMGAASVGSGRCGVSRPTPKRRCLGRSKPFRGTHGMVATDEELGLAKRRRNSESAAVETPSTAPWRWVCSGVVEPAAGNIWWRASACPLADGRTNFLRLSRSRSSQSPRTPCTSKETARSTRQLYVIGYKSVAVPGTVDGLRWHCTSVTLKLADVLATAIHLPTRLPVQRKTCAPTGRRTCECSS